MNTKYMRGIFITAIMGILLSFPTIFMEKNSDIFNALNITGKLLMLISLIFYGIISLKSIKKYKTKRKICI